MTSFQPWDQKKKPDQKNKAKPSKKAQGDFKAVIMDMFRELKEASLQGANCYILC